jgi:hypothetical protein
MHKGYTLNYFINFFQSIPAHRWTEGVTRELGTVRLDAEGHALAGANPTKGRLNRVGPVGDLTTNARLNALDAFLDGNTISINDGDLSYSQLGATPRGRILRALRNRKRTGNILG